MDKKHISKNDRIVLRELAKKQIEAANSPVNLKREKLWYEHNSLKADRPIVLIETGPFTNDLNPDSTLKCESKELRKIEKAMKATLKHFSFANDDKVVSPYFPINWKIDKTTYGVHIGITHGKDLKGNDLGHVYTHPIKNISEDFKKLKHSTFSVDRKSTLKQKEFLEDIFGDILPVKIKGYMGWTMGMTIEVVQLIGLENLMLYMYDEPEYLIKLMDFLLEDNFLFLDWMEKEKLLTLNNENDYVGSGTYGFTKELPKRNIENGLVTTNDMWGLIESQETVGVSPKNYKDFILPYHLKMAKRFGFVYYGCCEPVHERWEFIKKFPNLKTISISPWCDEKFMADKLNNNFIYSRKPHPTLLSTDTFDEKEIREDIKKTLSLTKSNNVEIIMKDLHTVNGDLNRIKRWVEIARSEIG